MTTKQLVTVTPKINVAARGLKYVHLKCATFLNTSKCAVFVTFQTLSVSVTTTLAVTVTLAVGVTVAMVIATPAAVSKTVLR